MVMVDDATNRVWAQFFEEETTHASYDMLAGWAQRQGLPQSLYVDRDSIYRCEGVGSVAEQLAGKEPQTQFGRAMKELGVELILANSPQAKGRVERMNGVLQDRLVKALRLEGISELKVANTFLRKKFLPAFNRKFEVKATSAADVHRQAPRDLDQVLSWEVERVVQRDWTLVHERRWYQLDREHEAQSLAGKKVIVRTLRDGTVQLERGGVKLKGKEVKRATATCLGTILRKASTGQRMEAGNRSSVAGWAAGSRSPIEERGVFGFGGFRSASATLRPHSIPQTQRQNQTQGTLSPEFLRGHF